MRTKRLEGWIFDAYAEPEGMRVWVLDAQGAAASFLDPWQPCLYLSGGRTEVSRALEFLRSRPFPVSASWTRRVELFSGQALRVLQVRVPLPAYARLVPSLRELGVSLYDADVHLAQYYHYERGHFPLARCAFEVQGGRLASWEIQDDPWALDYEVPPLRTLHLALSGSEVAGAVDPNHAPRGSLLLRMEGCEHELLGTAEEQAESLGRRLEEWDPDVITTDWGDSFLLERLVEAAGRAGRALALSRDLGRHMSGRKERSFYTYGRTVYQGGAKYLFGRWHLDMKNSFLLRETGLEGLFEIARIAKIPVQRAARCTIGTSLSSMQMAWAVRQGVLIPMDKAQAEDFRPATDLLCADKGGLVYEPDVGWHERVAEYDFSSMYPEMMVRRNISPETVNCACCSGEPVPEAGHHTCRRRRGLVPSVLEPLLKKRARCKALAKANGSRAAACKKRAAAHKWCLVCCFGYLGFKNARFGKIEAHECVTAWGREVLLRAKEAVESRGFHMLHALVDSLWIRVGPGTDLETLRLAIEKKAGCPLALEGVYKWLRFCPSRTSERRSSGRIETTPFGRFDASKQDALSGVPGRYFGAFSNGELKVRGLACRRRDTPKLIAAMQEELLRRLAQAGSIKECRALLPELEEVVETYRQRLREGRVSAEELAISFHLSKEPQEYVHDTLQALAAKQLAACGVSLHPGETVRFVIASAKDQVKDWRTVPLALLEGPLEYDQRKYLELLERAAEEVLAGLGP